MAHIIGTSGAWKAVCNELNRAELRPEKISDIPNLIKTAQEEYESTVDKSAKEVDNQIESLKAEVTRLESNLENSIKEYREETSKDLEVAKTQLQLLQDLCFIRKLLNFFKIKMIQDKIRQFQWKRENCPQFFQKKIDSAQNSFEETQKIEML
jgi:hypothetical protein